MDMKSDSKKQSPQVFRALRPFRAFAPALCAFAAVQATGGYYDEWYWPDPVSAETVTNAARGFVTMVQTASGGRVFGGCAVDGVHSWRQHDWLYEQQVFEDDDEEGGFYYDDNGNLDASGPSAWLVTLAPSGHVFMSGLDCMPPVAYFSEEDFAFDADCETAESEEGFDGSIIDGILDELEAEGDFLFFRATEMNADWDALAALGSAQSSTASSGTSATSGGASSQEFTVVPPLLATRYNQSQPFNDYAPVYDPNPAVPDLDDIDASYDDWESWQWSQWRGRASAGCVAIAGAQMLSRFRWPAFWDSYSVSEQWTRDGDAYDCLAFANGGGPVNWDLVSAWDGTALTGGFQKDGEAYLTDNWFDCRDIWNAASRHEVAKLCFWTATLSGTKFGVFNAISNSLDNSRASMDAFVRGASRWYAPGEDKPLDGSSYQQVAGQLLGGVPLLLQPGLSAFDLFDHVAVVDGCVQCGSMFLLHVNFGWGGEDDAWFAAERLSAWDGSSPSSVRLGFVPRQRAQLEPPPEVMSPSQTLSWSFPDIHTNLLSGWVLETSRFLQTAESRTLDFSSWEGSFNNVSNVFIDTSTQLGGNQAVLRFKSGRTASWEVPWTVIPSSRAVVSFRLGGRVTYGTTLSLQGKFDDGDWETLSSWNWWSHGMGTLLPVRVFMGGNAGRMARFRLVDETYDTFDGNGIWEIDDFSVSDSYFLQSADPFTFAPEARTATVSFPPGALVSFSLTPVLSAASGTGSATGSATGTATGAFGALPEPSDVFLRRVAGTADIPLPGRETVTTNAWEFPYAGDGGTATWNVDIGTVSVEDFALCGQRQVELSCLLTGGVADGARLAFHLSSTNYFGVHNDLEGFDHVVVKFQGLEAGETVDLCSVTNDPVGRASAGRTADYEQDFEVDLSAVADQPGKLFLSATHLNWTPSQTESWGFRVSGISIDGVPARTLPQPQFLTEAFQALGAPQFLSLSTAHGTPIQDGMFRECSFGNNVVYVKCSPSAVDLRAYSSHPLLLGEEQDISVHRLGGGEFALEIHGIDVPQAEARSRVILQLEALDANGTATQTDLVLRFSGEAGNEARWAASWTPPAGASSAGGPAAPEPVMVPYSWFVENGIVAAGARDDAFTRAAAADSDGDGAPNAAEWVCGTDPDSSDSALRADISFPAGATAPQVDWNPKDTVREGYEAVLEGREELGSGGWEPADTVRHHFFRATVRRE